MPRERERSFFPQRKGLKKDKMTRKMFKSPLGQQRPQVLALPLRHPTILRIPLLVLIQSPDYNRCPILHHSSFPATQLTCICNANCYADTILNRFYVIFFCVACTKYGSNNELAVILFPKRCRRQLLGVVGGALQKRLRIVFVKRVTKIRSRRSECIERRATTIFSEGLRRVQVLSLRPYRVFITCMKL